MSKYHIKDDGMPGKCSAATSESCPKTQAGDGFHGTLEEANNESQSRFEHEFGEAPYAHQKALPKDYSGLGGRELQKLAKDTEDSELQSEIARRGSDSAKKNLARNPHASSGALTEAYNSTDNEAVKIELASNLFADLNKLEPKHVGAALWSHREAGIKMKAGQTKADRQNAAKKLEGAMGSDWMNDATLNAYQEAAAAGRTDLRFRPKVPIGAALGNPKNKVTEDFAIAAVREDQSYGREVIESGKVSPERIGELPSNAVNLSGNVSGAHLSAAAEHISRGGWEGEGDTNKYYQANLIAKQIAQNERSPREALEPLVGRYAADQLALYQSKNLSPESKAKIAANDSSTQSYLRVQAAVGKGRTEKDLKEEITIGGSSNSTPRGYHTSHFQLDRDKIASYGLRDEDVERIMGGGGLYRYNPDTGVFGGSYDSGD